MNRREQREAVFLLLFERDFRPDETAESIFLVSAEEREIDFVAHPYVKNTYFGVVEHEKELDEKIGGSSNRWKTDRLSKAVRAILRLGAYEILFNDEIPNTIAINEALELAKKYDTPESRVFVNGVLNAVKDAAEAGS